MSTPSNLSEQILALPNGAGSVQSAGQTFEVRPYTGTGSYVIPIETRPGHAGIAPDLALIYSTHGGAGIAGVGWCLSVATVERRTDKGLPSFNDQADTFTLEQDELLPAGGGYYHFRIESAFKRIRHVRNGGLNFWVVTERNGARVFYGLEPDHRLHDDAGRISAWYVSKKQDANGNEVTFGYTRDAATKDVRLCSVEWAGCYRASLFYEERPDPTQSFRPGFEHMQRHRLSRVELKVKAISSAAFHTYRTYGLSYLQSALTGRSLLREVSITGFNPDGARHQLPSLRVGYAQPELADRTWRSLGGALPGGSLPGSQHHAGSSVGKRSSRYPRDDSHRSLASGESGKRPVPDGEAHRLTRSSYGSTIRERISRTSTATVFRIWSTSSAAECACGRARDRADLPHPTNCATPLISARASTPGPSSGPTSRDQDRPISSMCETVWRRCASTGAGSRSRIR